MAIYLDIEKRLQGFSLSIQIEAEDVPIALLGASGSGKSMTLRCIAGIETPDRGQIVLDGKTLFDSKQRMNLPPQERQTGLLFQNYALFPTMTVRQNIACGARRTGNQQQIDSLIQQFQLSGLEKRLPGALSGGQQQRVALARILASRPHILMLDEPFSALDTALRWQVERQIAELIENFEGTTILVSHDPSEVYRLCDQVAVLEQGHTLGMRKKDTLFSYPATSVEARLIGLENVVSIQKSSAGLKILDWNITLPLHTDIDISAVAVSASAFSVFPTAHNACIIPGKVLRILPEPTGLMAIVQPQESKGILYWRTSSQDIHAGTVCNLWLSQNDIHLLKY